jgi:xanthine dehydrogenase accessory factor
VKQGVLPSRRAEFIDPDHAALNAACEPGVALCTIVRVDGSFSRRCGAQIAVRPDGSVVGDLADTCLESQLASDARRATGPQVSRFGKGSPMIDFRLPCGGGLDILIDPSPDRTAIRRAADALALRESASLALPDNAWLDRRRYMPSLRISAVGDARELEWLAIVGAAAGIEVETLDKSRPSLGQPPMLAAPDRWTAVVLLFHDHEWEGPLLAHALHSDTFYIGAQGGEKARMERTLILQGRGFDGAQRARVKSPIGVVPGSRSPQALALSILSDVMSRYEAMHPHG